MEAAAVRLRPRVGVATAEHRPQQETLRLARIEALPAQLVAAVAVRAHAVRHRLIAAAVARIRRVHQRVAVRRIPLVHRHVVRLVAATAVADVAAVAQAAVVAVAEEEDN